MRKEDELENYGFDLKAQRRAKKYHGDGRKLDLIQHFVYLPLMVLFAFYGSGQLAGWAKSLTGNVWLGYLTYVAVFFAGLSLVDFPFDYGGYMIEQKYDLSNQSPASWLVDQLKSFGVSLLMALVLLPSIYLLISSSGLWWVYSWLVVTAVMVFMGFISPTVLMPLFYDFEPLEDQELAERLTGLAEEAGVEVLGAYKMGAEEKTEKAIGGLTGIGSTRRIILSDTLLDNFTADEIETVIAHELGHHVNGDLIWSVVQSSLITLFGLFVAKLFLRPFAGVFGLGGGIESLPAFLLLLGALFFLLSPLDNWISRIRERRADEFAREMTGAFSAQASSLVKLSKRNLSDAAPHPLIEFLFYDHPSALKRVRAADRASGGNY
uniref:Endopeptidase n=1 Tax=uncultured organism TaxID=155900 RepID=M1Q0Q7_9ZZZZ|nr:endopeptidase [uncultured organism]